MIPKLLFFIVYLVFYICHQIPKTVGNTGDSTLVEVSFRLEDEDADMIYAQDDAIDSQILGIIDEIKIEEKRYVDVLECISKVSYYEVIFFAYSQCQLLF